MQMLFALTLCMLLSSCHQNPKATEEGAASSRVPHQQLIILRPCPSFAETGKPALVYGAECGELLVKENPADSNSSEISLNILRLPAISPAAAQDPLFLIQGGPGGSSVDMATVVHRAFDDVRKNRDLIFVDQRGTGKSNPLLCEQLTPADELLPEDEQTRKSHTLIKSCAEKYRARVPFYTTPYAVQDLDSVRSALGYAKINLWGGSYGTRVALEYLRKFPQHARTAILDGVAPVQIALPKYFATDALAALEAVNKECKVQEKCHSLYGDIVEKAATVVQHLSQTQSNGEPVHIAFDHPRHQQLTHLNLTPKSFSSLLFMSLYSRDLTVLLPRSIADAERGDYRLMASLSALATEQASFTDISDGMRYSVICNEDAHFISAEDIATAKPFFGMNMLKDLSDSCALWPKAILPKTYNDPISSDIPTLLLSGNHDPVTPSHWAELVAKNLTHALQVVAPGGNHSISMEGCLPKIIAQFLELGKIEGIDTACVKNIVPLPLVLGANERKPSSFSSATMRSSSSYPSSARSSATSAAP